MFFYIISEEKPLNGALLGNERSNYSAFKYINFCVQVIIPLRDSITASRKEETFLQYFRTRRFKVFNTCFLSTTNTTIAGLNIHLLHGVLPMLKVYLQLYLVANKEMIILKQLPTFLVFIELTLLTKFEEKALYAYNMLCYRQNFMH